MFVQRCSGDKVTVSSTLALRGWRGRKRWGEGEGKEREWRGKGEGREREGRGKGEGREREREAVMEREIESDGGRGKGR